MSTFIPKSTVYVKLYLWCTQDILEKIPADPLEAELLMMADMVAGKDVASSSSSEEEEEDEPPPGSVII